MAGALIVTADVAQGDFSWLEGLRRAHYPPERNQVPAHLTMFHALPPSVETELRGRLGRIVRRKPPSAMLAGLMDLGGGVAFRVVSPELDAIREELADELHGMLAAQDSGGWRPHITIQNKVARKVARELKDELERRFHPRPLAIGGLAIQRYLDGPWERVGAYPFRP
jgi:2'-5' RNA ligase superfamily